MLRSAASSVSSFVSFVAESGDLAQREARSAALADFLARPAAGAGFLARAWAAIPVVELSLRLLGYKRTVAWIEAVPAKRVVPSTSASVRLGEQLVRGAYRAQPFRGGCLPRSLVQYLIHRRDGTRARFVVGVRRPEAIANESRGPGIEAHAWVETPDFVPNASGSFAPLFQSQEP